MTRRNTTPAAWLAMGLLALTACSSGSGSVYDNDEANNAPHSWLARTYEMNLSGSTADYLDRQDAPTTVAREIEGERRAADRITSDGMIFLRYDDDIVAVSVFETGSQIEVEDYDRGRQRWSSHVGNRWTVSQGRSGSDFRGGGPGSGK